MRFSLGILVFSWVWKGYSVAFGTKGIEIPKSARLTDFRTLALCELHTSCTDVATSASGRMRSQGRLRALRVCAEIDPRSTHTSSKRMGACMAGAEMDLQDLR